MRGISKGVFIVAGTLPISNRPSQPFIFCVTSRNVSRFIKYLSSQIAGMFWFFSTRWDILQRLSGPGSWRIPPGMAHQAIFRWRHTFMILSSTAESVCSGEGILPACHTHTLSLDPNTVSAHDRKSQECPLNPAACTSTTPDREPYPLRDSQ